MADDGIDELDPRLLDEDHEWIGRMNYEPPKFSLNQVARNVYPLPQYSTVENAHDMLDRMIEDVAIQSENGGRPTQIADDIVESVREMGGISLIVADSDSVEFVVRQREGANRGQISETNGIDHMLFDHVDDEEFGRRLAANLDDETLDQIMRDLVIHGHRSIDECREMLHAMEHE